MTRVIFGPCVLAGGKTSGIFGGPETVAQPQKTKPPGGQSSNIFGAAERAPAQSPSRSHPNKPKVSPATPPPPLLPPLPPSRAVVKVGSKVHRLQRSICLRCFAAVCLVYSQSRDTPAEPCKHGEAFICEKCRRCFCKALGVVILFGVNAVLPRT